MHDNTNTILHVDCRPLLCTRGTSYVLLYCCILCSGLVVYPNGPLDTSKSHTETPPCFRAFRQLLARIKYVQATYTCVHVFGIVWINLWM